MEQASYYFNREIPVSDFCVDIFYKNDIKRGENFRKHWHEHVQLYYVKKGSAILECGRNHFQITQGQVAIVNSNELHYIESLSDELGFYVIRIDPAFLFSNQVDMLQTKYLMPLAFNQIAFENEIGEDTDILDCIKRIIREHKEKKMGYELAIKSWIYQLLVLLLRRHVSLILSQSEFEQKSRDLTRFLPIFQMIEEHYKENISLDKMAECLSITKCHFCRLFKQITGQTATEYINSVRLKKAVCQLSQSDHNITEIAIDCGFDNINYFSRLFKKYYRVSPTEFRKSNLS
ncbi:transcriptional regulator, AraC family [Lachnospiraceae bacterium KM106-2]|nr:transcriptional regulator, AraC family [Lachnospiraceae bacterium KM106-2]